jgi:uncharacterized protein YodC (DUF2158 family)
LSYKDLRDDKDNWRMAESGKTRFIKGAQVRLVEGGPPMIIDVASAKLAICHWFVEGRRVEGVFDVRTLEPYSAGQQYDLWSSPDSFAGAVSA